MAASVPLRFDTCMKSLAVRVLLRAYVAGGRAAAALAAYAQARERLADDLGTDPSPETVALYTAILRGELPSLPPAAGRSAVGLVGRDDELAYLNTVALRGREGSTEIVVVDGEAGIGKTALLHAWAGQRAAAGDIVLIASCGQLDQAMPLDALLAALASLLRRLGPDVTADLLAQDASTLAPVLGVGSADPTGSGPRPEPVLADSMLGPAVLYAVLVRVIGRIAERGPLVVVIDDAHLAGRALSNWLSFARRQRMPAVVVVAVRSGEAPSMPASALVHLDLLGRDAAAQLVGPARADELYERSKGHPLFLTELAQQAASTELPTSLVESVSYADPALVAHHARLGGDLELASRSLRIAAERAAERFDHAAAEALLDDALLLHPDPEGWLERARVRTLRRRYGEALSDVERAAAAGPAALEVGAQVRLAEARALLTGDLVFGWRLDLRHQLICARLALLSGDAGSALATAGALESRAAALGVPRYVSTARVLAHRARRALNLPVDLDAAAEDLDRVERSVAVEAWWWTGETAADLAVPAWLDVAASRAERLARQAGEHADVLRRAAAQRLDRWSAQPS
jgi:AAA ATPase-like protein/transcriptional activator